MVSPTRSLFSPTQISHSPEKLYPYKPICEGERRKKKIIIIKDFISVLRYFFLQLLTQKLCKYLSQLPFHKVTLPFSFLLKRTTCVCPHHMVVFLYCAKTFHIRNPSLSHFLIYLEQSSDIYFFKKVVLTPLPSHFTVSTIIIIFIVYIIIN